MRTRINRIKLLGGNREIQFEPGLNIIRGEITSGKTPLLQLIHGMFGHAFEQLVPELREHVTHVEGSITLGESDYVVIRPLTTTITAKVDIAGEDEVLRLPVLRADETSSLTYGQWLLERLGLPKLSIPTAQRAGETTLSPVSINDYFMYCHLRSKEITTSVFGHLNESKNEKRIAVLQILYGVYDVSVYHLEADLRKTEQALRNARGRSQLLEQSFAGTAFSNRAALVRARHDAITRLEALEHGMAPPEEVDAVQRTPRVQVLRREALALDGRIAAFKAAVFEEEAAAVQMDELLRQLQSQIRRLTKAIVADRHLLDFDFLQCPRCGSAVNRDRATDDHCYLCLQAPSPSLTRADLEQEQRRLDAQVVETKDLADSHRETANRLREQVGDLERARSTTGAELDFAMRAFVGDAAEELQQAAAERARLRETILRYADYEQVLERMAQTQGEAERLEQQIEDLQARLVAAFDRQSEAGGRLQYLSRAFKRILDRFDPPHVAVEAPTYIDAKTYLPVVDGHTFEYLGSPALIAQVNVAHALAHHLTSLEFNLDLPAILLIDGPARNLGNTGISPQRKEMMYAFLIQISELYGDRLQIIVADDEVPEAAEPFVRDRLTERERLVRPNPVEPAGLDSAGAEPSLLAVEEGVGDDAGGEPVAAREETAPTASAEAAHLLSSDVQTVSFPEMSGDDDARKSLNSEAQDGGGIPEDTPFEEDPDRALE